MIKTLFDGSLILVISGFLLICSVSSEPTGEILTRFLEKVGALTLKQGANLLSNYSTVTECKNCRSFPYQISSVGLHDYYNILPNYGTLIK